MTQFILSQSQDRFTETDHRFLPAGNRVNLPRPTSSRAICESKIHYLKSELLLPSFPYTANAADGRARNPGAIIYVDA